MIVIYSLSYFARGSYVVFTTSLFGTAIGALLTILFTQLAQCCKQFMLRIAIIYFR
jgi:hypothetical protein